MGSHIRSSASGTKEIFWVSKQLQLLYFFKIQKAVRNFTAEFFSQQRFLSMVEVQALRIFVGNNGLGNVWDTCSDSTRDASFLY